MSKTSVRRLVNKMDAVSLGATTKNKQRNAASKKADPGEPVIEYVKLYLYLLIFIRFFTVLEPLGTPEKEKYTPLSRKGEGGGIRRGSLKKEVEMKIEKEEGDGRVRKKLQMVEDDKNDVRMSKSGKVNPLAFEEDDLAWKLKDLTLTDRTAQDKKEKGIPLHGRKKK